MHRITQTRAWNLTFWPHDLCMTLVRPLQSDMSGSFDHLVRHAHHLTSSGPTSSGTLGRKIRRVSNAIHVSLFTLFSSLDDFLGLLNTLWILQIGPMVPEIWGGGKTNLQHSAVLWKYSNQTWVDIVRCFMPKQSFLVFIAWNSASRCCTMASIMYTFWYFFRSVWKWCI